MAGHTVIKNLEAITIVSPDSSIKATFVPARDGAASSIIMPGKNKLRELLYLHHFFRKQKFRIFLWVGLFVFPFVPAWSGKGNMVLIYMMERFMNEKYTVLLGMKYGELKKKAMII